MKALFKIFLFFSFSLPQKAVLSMQSSEQDTDITIVEDEIIARKKNQKNYFKEKSENNQPNDSHVLYHLPGISLNNSSGPLSESQITYRGLNPMRLRINLESLNLNNPSLGFVDGNSMFLFAAQNIAIDGHKLLIKIPEFDRFKASGVFGYGSFNTFKIGAITGAPIGLDQNVFFASQFTKTKGDFNFGQDFIRKNNDQSRLSLLGKYKKDTKTFMAQTLLAYNWHEGGAPDFAFSPTDNLRIKNEIFGLSFETAKIIDKTKFSFNNSNSIFKYHSKDDKDNIENILSSSHEFTFGLKSLKLPSFISLDFFEQFIIEKDYEHKKTRLAIGLLMSREVKFQGKLKPSIFSDFSFWGYSEHGLLSKSDFGISIEPITFLDLYFRFARSERLPTFMELYANNQFFKGNPDLEKESIWDLEFGTNLRLQNFLHLNITAFFGYLNKTILNVPYHAFLIRPINADVAFRKGLDLSLYFEGNRFFRFESKGSIISSYLKNTLAPLPSTPFFSGLSKASFGELDFIYLDLKSRYKSKTFADIHQTLASKGYIIFDALLGFKIFKIADLSFFVDNLLNQKDIKDSYQMPLPGICFFGQIQIGNI